MDSWIEIVGTSREREGEEVGGMRGWTTMGRELRLLLKMDTEKKREGYVIWVCCPTNGELRKNYMGEKGLWVDWPPETHNLILKKGIYEYLVRRTIFMWSYCFDVWFLYLGNIAVETSVSLNPTNIR